MHAALNFFAVVVGETVYGLALGNLLGKLRLKITDPYVHMLASFISPFLAYIPAVACGGSGVLATVVTGIVIGNSYLPRFTPEARLNGRAVWTTIAFTLQGLLLILVGLNLRVVLKNISTIPLSTLAFYGVIVTLIVVIGRFVWVYPSVYIPRYISKCIRKKDPYPPWQ